MIITQLVLVELPEEDARVPPTSDEARIVLEPCDRLNEMVVPFEVKIVRSFTGVEFVNLNVLGILAGEVLSAVRELNLTAILDRDYFELL